MQATREAKALFLFGAAMVVLVITMTGMRNSVPPVVDAGPLRLIQLLAALLVLQTGLLLALLRGQPLLGPVFAPILLAAACIGLLVPPWANRTFDDTAQVGDELEIVRSRCGKIPPAVLARPLTPQSWARSEVLTGRRCRQLVRGDVVRLVDAEGALGARWRRAAQTSSTVGPIAHDRHGWKAFQGGDWETCVRETSASLEQRPGGDAGRIYANRGSCRLKLRAFPEAIEDFELGCQHGRAGSCAWLKKNADWIRGIRGEH